MWLHCAHNRRATMVNKDVIFSQILQPDRADEIPSNRIVQASPQYVELIYYCSTFDFIKKRPHHITLSNFMYEEFKIHQYSNSSQQTSLQKYFKNMVVNIAFQKKKHFKLFHQINIGQPSVDFDQLVKPFILSCSF